MQFYCNYQNSFHLSFLIIIYVLLIPVGLNDNEPNLTQKTTNEKDSGSCNEVTPSYNILLALAFLSRCGMSHAFTNELHFHTRAEQQASLLEDAFK